MSPSFVLPVRPSGIWKRSRCTPAAPGAQHAKYRRAIDQAFAVLRDHPQIGRPRDDLCPGCRGFPVEQHVIYYDQPDDHTIFVRRILHARQDAKAALTDPRS